jgi:hypothetical protein
MLSFGERSRPRAHLGRYLPSAVFGLAVLVLAGIYLILPQRLTSLAHTIYWLRDLAAQLLGT